MRRNRIFVMMICLIFVLSGYCLAQEKISLKVNLEPNASYLSTTEMNQTVIQTIGNGEQQLVQNMLMSWQYDVIDRDSSGATNIRLTYKRVKINQDAGGQVMQYDSDNPPETLDPSMEGMASLIGDQLTFKILPDGKVIDISGVEEMQDKMIQAMDIQDSTQRAMLVENLRKQYGETAIKQSLQQITGFYPLKPVNTGDTWKSDVDMNTGFPMRIESKYTLKSRSEGVDTIYVSSKITSNPKDNSMTMGPLKMAYDIKGEQSGIIVADEASGMASHTRLEMNFSGKVNVSGMPNEELQSWPIKATGTMIVTFEKL